MTSEHIELRKAAEMALEAMDMDAEDADKISWERLAKIVAAGVALKEAMAQLDRKCEAGPSLQDLWDCWDAAHGGQTPVAYRYKDSRAHYRYVGNRPNMDTSGYTILKLEPLYLHTEPIPEGWQLVPIEPTEEMTDCGAQGMASFQEDSVWPDSWDATQVKGMRHDATKAYRYMLAAAPKYEE